MKVSMNRAHYIIGVATINGTFNFRATKSKYRLLKELIDVNSYPKPTPLIELVDKGFVNPSNQISQLKKHGITVGSCRCNLVHGTNVIQGTATVLLLDWCPWVHELVSDELIPDLVIDFRRYSNELIMNQINHQLLKGKTLSSVNLIGQSCSYTIK